MIQIASKTIAQQGDGHDRIKITEFDSSELAVVLADGADENGGSGSKAAELVVERLSRAYPEDFAALFDTILDLDHQLATEALAGLSTVVSVYVDGLNFIGAVIGDSDALLIKNRTIQNLAPEKEILPLLGDGEAFPTMFTGTLENSILLICSDGFSKTVSVDDVLVICSRSNDPDVIVKELIESLESSDDQYLDDVSIVVMLA